MDLELRKRENINTIKLEFDVDISNADDFKNSALELLKGEKGDVYFDFSGVNFVDSTGLGAFVGINNLVSQTGGRVIIKGAKPLVRRVFTITKLDDVFLLED